MAVGKSVPKVGMLQLSLFAILSVVFVESLIGLATNSLAILSDAGHALFDTTTTLMLLLTTRISMKPPDEEHLYGHGKIESIGGLIAGLALLALASFLVVEAGLKFLSGGVRVHHGVIGFAAIGYTLGVDFFRIGILQRTAESGSLTVKANLYHAFSDLASTIIALLGFGLATIGFYAGDPLASIVLGALLAYLSTGLMRTSATELSDAVSAGIVAEIRKEILGTRGVLGCGELKVRRVGSKTYVETTVMVPDSMGLAEAHDLASKIESNILRSQGDSTVTVHIEPQGKGMPMEKQIESLATRVEGVKGVHNMSSIYSRGKLYVTLHALVDPELPLQEAHKIAEKIEENIEQYIENIENVTVHIEPFTQKLRGEFTLDDAEVREMIRQAVEKTSKHSKSKQGCNLRK